MKHIQPSNNWLFENYEEMMTQVGGYRGQFTPDVYSYWIKHWSKELDERIKCRLDIFLNSKMYLLEFNKLNIN